MRKVPVILLTVLSCLALRAQTGLSVYDRLTAQREAFPQERVYVHTDAEDYLQGDRIWLKAYLMDGADLTPVDSTLYVYAELFDKTGDLDLELLKAKETVHQTVVPLGYQRASDFSSAVGYRNKRTVYWNPQLLSDTFSFRLGDTPGTYLVVVEGVTSDGRLVHEEVSFEVSQ